MTLQKGICEECKKEYEYEYNPKYPRKYCHECSAKKKAEFSGQNPTGSNVKAISYEEKVPVVKPGAVPNTVNQTVNQTVKPTDKHTTMYVSYAKDIFLGLLESDNSTDREVLMAQAIGLIKQAKDYFS